MNRIVYAPNILDDETVYANWQYMLYEKEKYPGTPFLDLQIEAYEKEMTKRGNGNLYDFIEEQKRKLI